MAAGPDTPVAGGDIAVDPDAQGDGQVPASPSLATAAGTLDAALAAQIAADADDRLESGETGDMAADAMTTIAPGSEGAQVQTTAAAGAMASPDLPSTAEGESLASFIAVELASEPVDGHQDGVDATDADAAAGTGLTAPVNVRDVPDASAPALAEGPDAAARPPLAAAAGALPEGALAAAGGLEKEAATLPAQASERAAGAVTASTVRDDAPRALQATPEATTTSDAGARSEPRSDVSARPDPGLPQTAGRPIDLPAPVTAEPRAEVPVMPRALPPGAIPVEIGLRALQGLKEFQIRLDPAELGRVDVKLEIGDDKTVTARVVVDRVETLHLLQRDARTLERAFEQAGLKSSDGGIDITLRDPGQQSRDGRSDGEPRPGDTDNRRGKAPAMIDAPAPLLRRIHAGGLDLSI